MNTSINYHVSLCLTNHYIFLCILLQEMSTKLWLPRPIKIVMRDTFHFSLFSVISLVKLYSFIDCQIELFQVILGQPFLRSLS